MKTTFLYTFILVIFCSISANSQKSGDQIFDNSYIHEVRLQFDDSNFLNVLSNNFESTPQEVGNRVPYLMANVTIDGVQVDSIGVRYKGFTSYSAGSPKKPIKLDFNEFVPGKRYDGLRKLNLNNATGDPAMQRDVICYDLLRAVGVNASRTSYTKVYMNDVYYGLYQTIEQVDKEFLQNNFSNDDGNLFKNKAWSKFEYNGPNKSGYDNIFELKTNREEDDWSGFINLMDVLNNSSDTEFESTIESIFNVDLYLKTLAVDVATGNWDSYLQHGRNWYVYEDTNTGVFHWIPWDYNFALESTTLGGGSEDCFVFPEFASWTDGTESVKFYNSSYYTETPAYLYDFGDGNTSTEENPTHTYDQAGTYNVCLTVTVSANCTDQLCKTVDTNYNYANCNSITSGQFGSEINEYFVQTVDWNPGCCGTWNEDCQEIYGWISGAPGEGGSDFTVNQDDNEGVLIRRLMSVDKFKNRYYEYFCQMTNEEYTPEIYEAFINDNKALIETAVQNDPNQPFNYDEFVRDSGEEGILQTIKTRHEALVTELEDTYGCEFNIVSIDYQDIVINELVASSDSLSNIADAEGKYEDWIELYNNTNLDIDLSDIYLSDSKTDAQKWQFPLGTTIEANGYLMIWADDDEDQPGIHTNFKLNKAGDELRLSNNDGTVIDSITFGEQETNIAFARIPNGTGDFVNQGSTFGFNNEGTTSTKNIELEIAAKAYPNPTRDVITIEIDNDDTIYQLTIYNVNGRQILPSVTLQNKADVNVSNIAKGVYIARVFDENGISKNLRFIKL